MIGQFNLQRIEGFLVCVCVYNQKYKNKVISLKMLNKNKSSNNHAEKSFSACSQQLDIAFMQ